MDDKIRILDLGDKNEMRAALEQLKRSLPVWKEQAAVIAEIRKASYDAHIEQGFTPDQALELCKSMLL